MSLFIPVAADDFKPPDFCRILHMGTDAQTFIIIAYFYDTHRF